MSSPIVLAGFHRSGTSLASQIIHIAGVSYAIDPMPGNPSNPDGHFEDILTMKLHDGLLLKAGTNWQFHSESQIKPSSENVSLIRKYCQCRYELDGNLWLMKDPRATLYLNEWKQALNGRGRFVLMYRHWGSCVQSLFNRHSEDLAFNLLDGKDFTDNSLFWKDPELAAKMWLAYNKKMINFHKKNKDVSIVVAQEALLNGFDLPFELNNQFSFQLDTQIQSPIKANYTNNKIDENTFFGISDSLKQELEEVYVELQDIAYAKNNNEVEIVKSRLDPRWIDLLSNTIDRLPSDFTCNEIGVDEFKNLSFAEFKKQIEVLKTYSNPDLSRLLIPMVEMYRSSDPYNIGILEVLGLLNFSIAEYETAEKFIMMAVSTDTTRPYFKKILGDISKEKFEFDAAEYYYSLAIKGNSQNSDFYSRLSEIKRFKGNYQEALELQNKSLSIQESVFGKLRKYDIHREVYGIESAYSLLKDNLGDDVLEMKLISFMYSLGLDNTKEYHHDFIKNRIEPNTFQRFLMSIKSLNLDDNTQILYWISKAFSKVYTLEELQSLCIKQEGVSPSNPKISVVVISYNMQREIPRTIFSLSSQYQLEVDVDDIEIILVDNGSKAPPKLSDFSNAKNLRIVHNPKPEVSPVSAINLGLSMAKAPIVGVCIDGARIASPGLLNGVLKASKISESSIVSTLGFHLGPEVQMESVAKGYNQDLEDKLLNIINWKENGYRLFEISSLAGSSANGYFKPIAESNAIFMRKQLWQELNGYDYAFKTPGGGLSNLDIYKRACDLQGTELMILLNEGTFHQVHGGIATNLKRPDATFDIFSKEYKNIRNEVFTVPEKEALYIGKYVPQGSHFLKLSVSNTLEDYKQQDLPALNLAILQASNCQVFSHATGLNKEFIDSPVIITGRGGSGTRLLSELMQSFGLFLGNEINKTEDSIEWVEPIYDLVTKYKSGNCLASRNDYIQRLRNNALNILERGGIEEGLWGFKLPEAMLCMPELLEAFPNAKVIHLTRHPLSISFRRTHVTSRLDSPVGNVALKEAYKHHGLNFEECINNSDTFNNAVSWNYQLSNISRILDSSLPNERYIQIKYEDMVSSPEYVHIQLQKFLNIEITAPPVLNIDSKRLNFEIENTKAVSEIWDLTKEVAQEFGYTKSLEA
ncbi:hypothetical protein NBRC116188_18650 [Oceaniserpentilla sp. 4NH20-0058]|uniref:sulfotransferase n=1 Tax=Oceaniserpentilla sp. 4NH20-0058 TaxID=3127660 RepID=UPI00310621FE